MSILRNEYDLERKIDKNWFNSSNVLYSEFAEDTSENKGVLTVVFKNGKQYIYKDVSYLDYMGFKRASLDDSNGKSFNNFIIKKYKGEKDGEANVSEIIARLDEPEEKEVTYYIHGEDEFNDLVFDAYYASSLDYIYNSFSDAKFIFRNNDVYGEKSAYYLLSLGIDPKRITIYGFKGDDLSSGLADCRIIGLNKNEFPDDSLDFFLVRQSFDDIAYVSPASIEEVKKISRSASIMLQRKFV